MGRGTANLRPWKPGQSGNPSGRPKKRLLDTILIELLEDSDGANTIAIARALIEKAKRGDLRACQLIAERTEGRPRQQLDIDADARLSDSACDFSRFSDKQLEHFQEFLEMAIGSEPNQD